jgi:glycosyltransferase involved in cell wall biosynthesis
VRGCDFFDPAGGSSMRRHHIWRLRYARSFFVRHPSDFYHLLDGSMAGFLPQAVWSRTVVSVHDLIPLLQMHGQLPGTPGIAGRLLIRRMVKVLRQVAGLAAVSEYTARDLLEFTGRPDVTVIHNPVRSLPAPDDRLELPARYLFHIGNNANYKNRMGVLDVFAQLQDIPDLHLLMAGPPPPAELRVRAAGLPRVQFLENPSDAQLSMLYKKAAAFLFPSLYEGFGMPVLEAMQAGCPVVCSSAASLPEVAGEAALMASATDPEALAQLCRRVLTDPVCRGEIIRRGRRRAEYFTMQRLSADLQSWYTEAFKRVGVLS